jgi:hypothetical protein
MLEERKQALGEAYTFNDIKSTTRDNFLIFFHVDRLGPKGEKIVGGLSEVSKQYRLVAKLLFFPDSVDKLDA